MTLNKSWTRTFILLLLQHVVQVKRGLLAEGTMCQIRERISQLLVQHGMQPEQADLVVTKAISGALPPADRTVRPIVHLEKLFAELKRRGIKVDRRWSCGNLFSQIL